MSLSSDIIKKSQQHHHDHDHSEKKETSARTVSAAEQAKKYYRPAAERLRIILMFLLCILTFGLPTGIGETAQFLCGFVPMAFFILSGYFVLREDAERPARILRTVKRTAIAFAVMFVGYLIVNLIAYAIDGESILAVLTSGKFWFDFLVLNLWQLKIGKLIWYVQALLYGYVIILLLEKAKLMKLDWVIAVLCLILNACSGEFSGVLGFSFAGYGHLPENFVTFALPFLLIGCFVHRKINFFFKIHRIWYWIVLVLGLGAALVERSLLGKLGFPGYYSSTVGTALAALAVCLITFKADRKRKGFETTLGFSRQETNLVYFLCEAVGYFVILLFSGVVKLLNVYEGELVVANLSGVIGIISFVLCFLIALAASRIRESKTAVSED